MVTLVYNAVLVLYGGWHRPSNESYQSYEWHERKHAAQTAQLPLPF